MGSEDMRILVVEGDRAESRVLVCSIESTDRIDNETLAVSVGVKRDTELVLLLNKKDVEALQAHFLDSADGEIGADEPPECHEELLLVGGE